jgi:hypothetical protein
MNKKKEERITGALQNPSYKYEDFLFHMEELFKIQKKKKKKAGSINKLDNIQKEHLYFLVFCLLINCIKRKICQRLGFIYDY